MAEIVKAEEKKPSLKFKAAIDSLKLSITCPEILNEIEDELNVFRFCHNPIDVKNDFLPNVLYDKIVGMTYNYTSTNKNEIAKCGRCGASFHKKIDGLLLIWKNMNKEIKEKLGYKSISEGKLQKGAGLIRVGAKGHIGLYEYEGATFHSSFKIVGHLE